MTGIKVTYQPVVLEPKQSHGIARGEGPPGELTHLMSTQRLV